MTRHYFHVADEALRGAAAALPDVVTVEAEEVEGGDAPKGAAETRARALPGPGAASVPADDSGASGGVLGRFRAIVAELSPDELPEAARILNRAMRQSRTA